MATLGPEQIERLHDADGDYDDLGWYAKGHHSEADFRAALEAYFWRPTPTGSERYKHPCEADETECTYFQGWWRVAFGRLQTTAPHARGAFPVTALLTDNAEF
jgi:hypothetical protein